jgi:dTMP kinase
MSESGVFIVFEGGDGVGKSTQIDLLAVWLRSPVGGNRKVLTTREPGGTPLGQELRQAVMHGDHVAPRAEALLYAADRAHHVATVVRPALARGAIVVQDRYVDSSIVYQGGARGLGPEVERISRWATEGLLPHLTVLLDMEPSSERMSRDLDRVERETSEGAQQMRAEYLALAAREPDRYAVINAAQSIEMVHREVRAAVAAVIERGGQPPHAELASEEPRIPVVPHRERGHR